ncbi:DUF3575 domain-containing protein [Sphingobacterium corticis]|uniref:DUF3575 domain-containing protein n=1 Tax=Sphingobacterium corticis TaxID=1812823 RepID=A0ABW5NLX3_9SPHI
MNRLLSIFFISFLTVIFMVAPASVSAQRREVVEQPNLIKLNALSLFAGKFGVEYERLITERISVGAELGWRPNSRIPFRSAIKGFANDGDFTDMIDGFKSSSFSFTPEVRFYTSKRGPFRGFYVAPYVRYASFGATAPYDLDINFNYMGQLVYERYETIPLTGRVRSFTGGASIGANFKLAEKWYLDWRIIGPSFGSGRGSVAGNVALNEQEQQAIREDLAELQQDLRDFPLSIKTDYTVDGNGIKVDVQRSKWAAVRAGLSIAYRF